MSSGGWDKDDHEEFVRIVRSCGGDYTRAVAVCMERVVGFSRSEVMDHARWHMDYMDLLVRWVHAGQVGAHALHKPLKYGLESHLGKS